MKDVQQGLQGGNFIIKITLSTLLTFQRRLEILHDTRQHLVLNRVKSSHELSPAFPASHPPAIAGLKLSNVIALNYRNNGIK